MNYKYMSNKFSLIVLFFLISPAFAYCESSQGECPMIPRVDLEEALLIGREKVKETLAQGQGDVFPDEAALICRDGEQVWRIGWRQRAYESGHFYIEVLGDKSAKIGPVVKDR